MYARTAWALGLLLVTWNTTQHARAYEIDRKQNRVVLSSIADFSRCQDQAGFSDLCLEGLKDYVKTHPSERLAAGKAVRLRFNHWVALHFFAGALDKASPEQCADEDVSMAVVSGLALPSDHPNLTLAQKIVDGRCGAALQAPVKQALKDGGGHYQDHACPWLKKQNVDAPECAPQPQVKATPTPPRAAKLGSLNAHALPTDPQSALAFRGEENEQLLLVRARAPHDDVVLLKWKGLRGPWNNQIIAAGRGRARPRQGICRERGWQRLRGHDPRRGQLRGLSEGLPGQLAALPSGAGEPGTRAGGERDRQGARTSTATSGSQEVSARARDGVR